MAGKTVNVGLIGCGFMGKLHSFAYRTVNEMWDPPVKVVTRCIAGNEPEPIVRAMAAQYGWESYETDWRKLIARDDIDLVDISTPNYVHYTQAMAAIKAGKDIFCEKPLANNFDEARRMTQAVEKAGLKAMCGFTYRQAPAVQLARQMIQAGELGEIYHFRARYLQDWIHDPNLPLLWRFQRKFAGSGTSGDIGAHIADMALFLIGPIREVIGDTRIFIKERPLLASTGGTGLSDRKGGTRKGKVNVDDAAAWLARFEGGPMGVFEATRLAGGRKNNNCWEINGTKASLAWDFEHMNYLEYWKAGEGRLQGYRRINATRDDIPNTRAWWPEGHGIGYGECFTNEINELLVAIANDREPVPSFRDGLKAQAVIQAVLDSVKSGRWTRVPKV